MRRRITADIGAPDRIAFGLTFRQLALAGGVGLGGFSLYRALGHLLPPAVWLILAVPVGAVTVVVAIGRRDGLPLDVWLRHGLMLTRTPRTLVPGQPRTSSFANVDSPFCRRRNLPRQPRSARQGC